MGFEVVGLDRDPQCVAALRLGQPPVVERGLPELIRESMASGLLSFTTNPEEALDGADCLWVTFDTPVDEDDHADPDWVRAQLEDIRQWVRPETIVIVSSQVPVGFTGRLERDWRSQDPSLRFACMPENLRLGAALDVFLKPERIIVGVGENLPRERLSPLVEVFSAPVVWMSLASAEMSKHALNGFLALCVAYTNELARICERVDADAGAVERGLRTDPRVGERAYVSAGAAFAGGTLARDIRFLSNLADERGLASPLVDAVMISNELHKEWVRGQVATRVAGIVSPRVALLGLTYKPGTDTLRRSSSLELAAWLSANLGVQVSAYDPSIRSLPDAITSIQLASDMLDCLHNADAVVLATAWPEFRALTADAVVDHMRRPCVIDQAGFLEHLASDARVQYVKVGRPVGTRA
jgi:UDPglucose 6-dehydrogenase